MYIDLNGHTIKGPGPSVLKNRYYAVATQAVEQIIGPGTIAGFQAGILDIRWR